MTYPREPAAGHRAGSEGARIIIAMLCGTFVFLRDLCVSNTLAELLELGHKLGGGFVIEIEKRWSGSVVAETLVP